MVTGLRPFNTDMINDEDFSPCGVTDRSLQDSKNLKYFVLSDSHDSNSNLDVSSQPSTSGLSKGRSSSESNLHHITFLKRTPFQKQKRLKTVANREQGWVLD
jgi:hypothetical protein